ncbi:MAG TPA: acetyl-CoA carboxylase biotin carboxyl carrier protein [Geobacteraceae bacterium]|nr:acetyl-CoA carboxylase biotin carboxyl carrier protein [Geobacteraceae bacterium]
MDIKEIKSLIKMIMETDISEFELESTDEKIRIKRGEPHEVVHYQAAQISPNPTAQHVQPAPAPVQEMAPAPAAAPPEEEGKSITSPIVGTFYRAPAPDAPPYAEVGQVVEKGQVLCIIEAMKLMNEIESEFRGRVIRICKENAQPVEFGDVLFVVEPI